MSIWSFLRLPSRRALPRLFAESEEGFVDTALHIAENNTATVQAWLAEGRIGRAELADAEDWHARQPMFWAVVVAPWVLVQEVLPELND